MKVNKILGVGLVTVGLLGLAGISSADEQKVYIPNAYVRQYLLQGAGLHPDEVENQLPTISQLETITEHDESLLLMVGHDEGAVSESLEGLDYVKNVKTIMLNGGSGVTDFRPLRGAKDSVEVIDHYSPGSLDLAYDNAVDLSFLDGFTKLKNFHMVMNVTDLSAFDSIPTMERINIDNEGDDRAITSGKIGVSRSNKALVMANPIIYSTHFSNQPNAQLRIKTDTGATVSIVVRDDMFYITDIPVDAKTLTMTIEKDTEFEIDSEDADMGYAHHRVTCEYEIKWY
ncbi:hypothetical protein I6N96_12500 [Enterococcus sp. BWM-S5]|uniref:Uncharacterized protein n=1 Tax=Enterococcus larvae TaxID=2794352 RepID=A0ABS4CLN7_9ENTE|nr:hypothetical protein [Enterococcus larvae]MBP1047093.1 hypothetical protein [Enterococcus larvae]